MSPPISSRFAQPLFLQRNPQLEPCTERKAPKFGLLDAPQQDVFERAPTVKAPATPKAPPVDTSGLDLAISAIDQAVSRLEGGGDKMEAAKTSLEAVKSALELVKVSKQNGDTKAYVKAVSDLASKTMLAIGHLVKAFGSDPELAKQACEQLTTVAKVFGSAAKVVSGLDKVVKGLDLASMAINGTDLAGNPATKEAAIGAVYELVKTVLPPPVRLAVEITELEARWLFTEIYAKGKAAITTALTPMMLDRRDPNVLAMKIGAMDPSDPRTFNALVTGGAMHLSGPTTNEVLMGDTLFDAQRALSQYVKGLINKYYSHLSSISYRDLTPELREEMVEFLRNKAVDFVRKTATTGTYPTP